MNLERWPTIISDCKSLYFKKIVDCGQGKFIVQADSGEVFEILIGKYSGPYIVCDEEFLTKYWDVKPIGIGWTFIVHSSELSRLFPGVMEFANFRHYVESTMDSCLEILSEEEPTVRRVKRCN